MMLPSKEGDSQKCTRTNPFQCFDAVSELNELRPGTGQMALMDHRDAKPTSASAVSRRLRADHMTPMMCEV